MAMPFSFLPGSAGIWPPQTSPKEWLVFLTGAEGRAPRGAADLSGRHRPALPPGRGRVSGFAVAEIWRGGAHDGAFGHQIAAVACFWVRERQNVVHPGTPKSHLASLSLLS